MNDTDAAQPVMASVRAVTPDGAVAAASEQRELALEALEARCR